MMGFPQAPAAADHECQGAPADCISDVSWSPAGGSTILSCTSWDKSVRLWDVQTQVGAGNLVTAIQTNPLGTQQAQQPLLSSCVTPDGRCFYGGCDKAVTMWTVQTGQTQQVAAHDLPISHVEYVEGPSVPAPMLITSSWDGKVRFWDLRQSSGQAAKEENFQAPIIHFDASTAPLASFLQSRKVHLYQLSTMTRYRDLDPVDAARFQFRKVSNFKDQSYVSACTVDGRVLIWPVQQAAGPNAAQPFQFKCHGGEKVKGTYDAFPINLCCIHPSGKTVLTGGGEGVLKSFDISTKTKFAETPAKLVNNVPIPVSCGALSGSGTMLAYAYSYDWAKGKDGYNPQGPRAVMIKALKGTDVR